MAVRNPSARPEDRDGPTTGTVEWQRQTITELQTPVLQVWDRILALPIIGSVDTARRRTGAHDLRRSCMTPPVLWDVGPVPEERQHH